MRLVSQLIKDISRVPQKLLQYFNGTAISTVAIGTYSFVSVIANFVFPVAVEIPQSSDQVRMSLSSQLITDVSRVIQKLLKYFNDTDI